MQLDPYIAFNSATMAWAILQVLGVQGQELADLMYAG